MGESCRWRTVGARIRQLSVSEPRKKEVEKRLNYCQPDHTGGSRPGLEQDSLCWRLIFIGDVHGH
jgi:hypothetical protein